MFERRAEEFSLTNRRSPRIGSSIGDQREQEPPQAIRAWGCRAVESCKPQLHIHGSAGQTLKHAPQQRLSQNQMALAAQLALKLLR
jgi:hypothetical protein